MTSHVVDGLRVHFHHDLLHSMWYATLLGGEFDNCDGQGPTPEMAISCLKIVIRIRRKRRALAARLLTTANTESQS